jgi:hypothetical protein
MLPALKSDTTTRATQAQVLQALASLAGLPSRQADDAELDRKMYHVALEGVSRYALNEAVKAIIRGALGHTFFPSPVEFRLQCEKAIEPHIRQAERIRRREQQESENAQFERVIASRTPEAVARQQEAYRRFCEQYAASKPISAESVPMLDPELVAKVPDASSTFKRAKVA